MVVVMAPWLLLWPHGVGRHVDARVPLPIGLQDDDGTIPRRLARAHERGTERYITRTHDRRGPRQPRACHPQVSPAVRTSARTRPLTTRAVAARSYAVSRAGAPPRPSCVDATRASSPLAPRGARRAPTRRIHAVNRHCRTHDPPLIEICGTASLRLYMYIPDGYTVVARL